jgi:hypothetical protein
MKYQGSCHCGQVKLAVEGTIDSGMACNCSMCQRKGALLWFVPRKEMQLLTPESDTRAYLFNKHKIKHRFCPTCGIHVYGEAAAPSGEMMAAINVRCIEGIDLDSVPVKHFDGRAL